MHKVITTRSKKRIGRGYGSGKGGHTIGRGTKGQKARGSRKVGVLFEGLKVRKSLLSRLPMRRGKEKFHANPKPIVIPVEALNLLKDDTTVDVEALIKAGIVNAADVRGAGVKILGGGKLEKKLTVVVPTSGGAADTITKAGGVVK
ncbi:50S ribosomal protein L15 [Candidatus Woesebacteria bacterium RIFCSPHIGHO2_01_FULL_41_10]|uniref:Large ribosomal subunit protein uL15 n=1 Tax=Candidatus Woesebacteria bacterium RIFCSPHIGHO2_01_FULL_41_10 TaxID=1802500 RepID=A0A1F7YSI2_9BACT|nr:MAG: 50S ribosomal protein L15 [Candidatus Woesebacteria bacterium RIFCSPHIGHO2_01_FULL_41_10]